VGDKSKDHNLMVGKKYSVITNKVSIFIESG
jgi:hypothetical protein